jgi:hypothetical protein
MSIPATVTLSLASSYGGGLVSDGDVVHAVRPTISGYRAWCGAGGITQFTVARFDSVDPASCTACEGLLRATTPLPRRAAD